jgi:hypothetical protein
MTSIIYKSGTSDRVACGDARTARRISRLPLSSGRPRGWRVRAESIGQLGWCSRGERGITDLNGYVSRSWARENGVDC